jgi:hypothetical protein
MSFLLGTKSEPTNLGAELRAKADKVNSDTKLRVVGELKVLMDKAAETGKYELVHLLEGDLALHFDAIVKMLADQGVTMTRGPTTATVGDDAEKTSVLLSWGK